MVLMLQTLITQMQRILQFQNQNLNPDQDQNQVPAGQAPVPQPVPAQLAPAGLVPQIIYQN